MGERLGLWKVHRRREHHCVGGRFCAFWKGGRGLLLLLESERTFLLVDWVLNLGMERDVFLCGSGLKSGVQEAENGLVTLYKVNLKVIIVTK
jgi:hypothetical protein